jgi:DNA-3-methyladenine glycosylase I
VNRCWWCGTDPLYVEYHDTEWGKPVTDDRRLFEKVCLEGFQAGLSWLTILRKRENFRRAFANFDLDRVARYTARDVNRLLKDDGIIRHRGKIESTINNAQRAIELGEECGSLSAYFWQWEPDAASRRSGSRARPSPVWPRHRSPSRSAETCVSADGRSWVRRRFTPSCRRWAWSTITSRTATSAVGELDGLEHAPERVLVRARLVLR